MDEEIMKQKSDDFDLVQVLNLEQEIAALEQNYINAKDRLEKLQKELADTERKKKETDLKLSCAREEEAAEKRARLEEISAHKEQIGMLKKQCEALSVKSEQMHRDMSAKTKELQDVFDKKTKELQDGLDIKTRELQSKNIELEEADNQLDSLRREQKVLSKKRKSALIAVLVFSVALMLFESYCYTETIFGWKDSYEDARDEKAKTLAKLAEVEESFADEKAGREEAEAKLAEAEESFADEKAGREEALAKLVEIGKYTNPIMLRVDRVYNSWADFTEKSDDLKASEMRYLSFDCDFFILDDSIQEATIFVDIYNPNGTLARSSNSPGGHTYSIDISKFRTLKTWCRGSENQGNYKAGTYRVDYIYEDVIIHSQKVIITD